MTESPGTLWLIATPIGNKGDWCARAVEVLQNCDVVAAEDTRRSGILLAEAGVRKPMISYFDANERERGDEIVARCLAGQTVAVVTSAGHPGVSDPGYHVVRAAHAAGVRVSVVPGPCAAVSALAVSGLPTDLFTFHGFLPRKGKDRDETLARMSSGVTHLLYESPRRVVETLRDLKERFANPPAAVIRELTKLFEEILTGTCGDLADALASRDEVLGEITVAFRVEASASSLDETLMQKVRDLKSRLSLSDKDAAQATSILCGVPRNAVYQALIGRAEPG